MENIKRTFFLSKDEAEKQKEITGKNISFVMPHHQLENGVIAYCTEQYVGGQTHYVYQALIK